MEFLDDEDLDLVRAGWLTAKAEAFPQQAATRFGEYDGDLPRFSTEVLGNRQWEFQKHLQRALIKHRFVMVCGPRKNSKSHTTAESVLGMMSTAPTIVLTTSGSERQVSDGLWQKIRAMHAQARFPLPGRPRQARWEIAPEWYAMGFSASNPNTVAGFHAGVTLKKDAEDAGIELGEAVERIERAKRSVSRLFLVLDEAASIRNEILERLEGSMSGQNVYALAVCNPTFDPESQDAVARWWRPGSGWYRIHVAGEELPDPNWEPHPADKCFHAIPEEIQEPAWRASQIRSHGIGSAYVRTMIFGLPASEELERALIPRSALEQCAELPAEGTDRHIGVDIGGGGRDPSVAYLWIGNTLAARHEWRNPDTMVTAGVIIELMREWGEGDGKPVPSQNVHVDATGIGKGVADRLKQTGHAVDAVDFGAAPRYSWKSLTGQSLFRNMRGEMHWTLRRLLEERMVSIPRRYAEVWRQAQWYSYGWHEAAKGTQMELGEAKEDIVRKYGRSPDDLDAAILGLARKPVSRPSVFLRPM